jgi:hypothetical protein
MTPRIFSGISALEDETNTLSQTAATTSLHRKTESSSTQLLKPIHIPTVLFLANEPLHFKSTV